MISNPARRLAFFKKQLSFTKNIATCHPPKKKNKTTKQYNTNRLIKDGLMQITTGSHSRWRPDEHLSLCTASSCQCVKNKKCDKGDKNKISIAMVPDEFLEPILTERNLSDLKQAFRCQLCWPQCWTGRGVKSK